MTITEMPFNGIGSLIRAKRIEKGWTQQQLADNAGLTAFKWSEISRFETGKRFPSRKTLEALLNALDSELYIHLKDKTK